MKPSVPRVAAIHDLSCFGRTSLTVVIPVLSALGVQACPLPTALLSTHTTGFTDFTFLDLSPQMHGILDHWQALGLTFDAVYSGFLGTPEQVELVARCIDRNLAPGGFALVDPVLGDNGLLDPTITPLQVERMRWLLGKAHIITPNFTEAAFLLGEPCRQSADAALVRDWLTRLCALGPHTVVITSVPLDGGIAVVACEHGRFWKIDCTYIPVFYPGTGDTFASVLTGALLQGDSLPEAMDRAVEFVTLGIRAAFGHPEPTHHGILLEKMLPALQARPRPGSYERLPW